MTIPDKVEYGVQLAGRQIMEQAQDDSADRGEFDHAAEPGILPIPA